MLSWALLVFLVIAFLGFVDVFGHCFHGFCWCFWSLLSWVLLAFMVMFSLFLLLFM